MLVAIFLWPLPCKSAQQLEEFQTMVHCGDDVDEGQSAIYSGHYQYELEHSSFRISDRCGVWLDIIGGDERQATSLFITVEGVISPRGHYGHFGMWERELHVTKVLKIEPVKEE
jgi:hypothetical protein